MIELNTVVDTNSHMSVILLPTRVGPHVTCCLSDYCSFSDLNLDARRGR